MRRRLTNWVEEPENGEDDGGEGVRFLVLCTDDAGC